MTSSVICGIAREVFSELPFESTAFPVAVMVVVPTGVAGPVILPLPWWQPIRRVAPRPAIAKTIGKRFRRTAPAVANQPRNKARAAKLAKGTKKRNLLPLDGSREPGGAKSAGEGP